MNSFPIFEIIGYLASLVIAFAMLNSSFVRLRIFSLAGNILFVIYGLAIHAYPIAGVNLLIAVVNIYFLNKVFGSKDIFKVLEVRTENRYLVSFLCFYKKEIEHYFPGFNYKPGPDTISFFVLRNMNVAGVFVGEKKENGELSVTLDFVIPQYRDHKLGTYLYSKNLCYFNTLGFSRITSPMHSRSFNKYLKKMGFKESEFFKDILELQVPEKTSKCKGNSKITY